MPDAGHWTKEERDRAIALRASNPKKYGPTRIAKETGIPVATIRFWLDAASWVPKSKTGTSSRHRYQDWESWRGEILRNRFLALARDKRYPHHGPPPSRQELIAWVRVQVMVCAYCARALNTKIFSVDHAQPVVRGGTSALDNLRACCKHCNEVKESMTEAEYRQLLALVAGWQDGGKKLLARLRSAQVFLRTGRAFPQRAASSPPV